VGTRLRLEMSSIKWLLHKPCSSVPKIKISTHNMYATDSTENNLNTIITLIRSHRICHPIICFVSDTTCINKHSTPKYSSIFLSCAYHSINYCGTSGFKPFIHSPCSVDCCLCYLNLCFVREFTVDYRCVPSHWRIREKKWQIFAPCYFYIICK
jgi:hypothetical protein